MRLVAEGLDTEQKTDVHGRALAAALTAMKEAEDFLPGGSRLEADVDLAGIIAAHTTPVLKTEAGNVTSMTALKCYFTFAQEQFAAAAGHEVAGSMALHALGKLHDALAQKKSGLVAAAESKAMVFYQAALLVYPKNFMAANDLGVLLAQCGNYADARTMLEHSLSLCPQSATWHNLAVVYRQLGQTALGPTGRPAGGAAPAGRDCAAEERRPATANDSVQWVDPQTFAQTSTQRAELARRDSATAGKRRRRRPSPAAPTAAGRAAKAATAAVGGRTNVLGITGIPTMSEAVRP